MKSPSAQKGFTLVELLVSIAIFTLITTVAVFNHSEFNGSVLLTNLAYEIALSVRQAQFYGITVKQSTADASRFDSGYGVHFDASTPTSYILFEDKAPQNHVYDVTEDVETFNIAKGNKIKKVCVDGACDKSSVDISFIRPNPDAYIRAGGLSYAKAEICVASPANTLRRVVVESTGQISVSADVSICE